MSDYAELVVLLSGYAGDRVAKEAADAIKALVQERNIAFRERNDAIQASMNDMGAKQRAESALAECMKHADAMAKELDIVGEAANLATYSDLAFREWRAKQ